jgi:hypothetical protein
MTFEEFQEKYKDVRIKEFFPLWEDGGVVGDIKTRLVLQGYYLNIVYNVVSNVQLPDIFSIVYTIPENTNESFYLYTGCNRFTFKQLSEQYEQKQKWKNMNRDKYIYKGKLPIDLTVPAKKRFDGIYLVRVDLSEKFILGNAESVIMEGDDKEISCGDYYEGKLIGVSEDFIHYVVVKDGLEIYSSACKQLYHVYILCEPKEVEIPEYTMEELTKKLGHDFKIKK